MSKILRHLLHQTISDRGLSLSAVSRRLRPTADRSWLSKALRGLRPLRIRHVDDILEIIGEPPSYFWRQLADAHSAGGTPRLEDIEPALLLRTIFLDEDRPSSGVLDRVFECDLPTLSRDSVDSLPARALDLECLRRVDRHAAFGQAQAWIAELLDTRRHTDRILRSLVSALGVTASIARSCRQSHLAARLLSRAYEILGSQQDGFLMANLLWRSGVVLTDAGLPKIAVSFLQRALGILRVLTPNDLEAMVLVSLGSQYYYLGRHEAGRRCFEHCLQSSVASEESKARAGVGIALLHEQLGEPLKALAILADLEDVLHRAPRGVSVAAQWIEARALALCQRPRQAARLLEVIGPDIARFCEPVDPILHFCDYAPVLIQLNDLRRLRVAAESLAEILPQLETTKLAKSVVGATLERIAKAAPVNADEIRDLRRDVAAAVRPADS